MKKMMNKFKAGDIVTYSQSFSDGNNDNIYGIVIDLYGGPDRRRAVVKWLRNDSIRSLLFNDKHSYYLENLAKVE